MFVVGDERLTSAGEAATGLVLATFRLNGALLAAGDRLTADQALTAALWQVLGAIVRAERPLSVAQIARRMGLSRQSVHASVRRLRGRGLLEFAPNEDHRRSPLVQLTDAGVVAHAAVSRKQVDWVNRVGAGIAEADLETATRVLDTLCRRLEQEDANGQAADSPHSAA
jgi:DNA-binding MarR family transcriptional regulator